jgi:asparagine synthase (glutamine-hydrolysing)
VQVGINLSGGLDSSLLLGLVQATQGADCDVRAFTFVTGDDRYDELPWVQLMLANTRHPLSVVPLCAEEVPALAEAVQRSEDEPYGGIPTLAYAKLFECARAEGVTVLLDGQGMDEQWAGYDYYATPSADARVIQGTTESATRPDVLHEEFRSLARPLGWPRPFGDRLRDLQYRDVRFTKLPRALRFNDRVSMRVSTELREPFLDHRLVELALPQPEQNKIRDGVRKWLPRRIASTLLPAGIVEAPKRPVQTPQREWLRGPLREWVRDCIESAIGFAPEWFDASELRRELSRFNAGDADNGFFVWQWISLGLMSDTATRHGACISSGALAAQPTCQPLSASKISPSST